MCRTMNELEKVIADYRSLKSMKEQLEEELKAVERDHRLHGCERKID
jgi:glutamate-1-semialdehyde aminotransferase